MNVQRAAVVIGGSRGIGRASAVLLAQRGFRSILVNYVSDAVAAAKAVAAVEAAGAQGVAVQADVSRDEDLAALVSAVRQRLGTVDALVYSAGYRVLLPTMQVDMAQWSRALDVTLTGFVRSVQELSVLMGAGGKIVGISGISGIRAYTESHLVMGTAKAASHHAMRYLACELAGRSINVNMVCFGAVLTESVSRDLSPEQYEELIIRSGRPERIPMGRVPEPAEAARVVAFLCSPDADWVVGQVLVADGGETLR